MIQVLFVCLGNICRSPMAEAVFQHLVNQANLQEKIKVDSVGTGGWHVGEPAHPGTREILGRRGIRYDGCARQVTLDDLHNADYLVAMDEENLRALRRLDRQGLVDAKLALLMDFAQHVGIRHVPDPYYEDNFDHVYELVEAGCRGLLQQIRAEHKL
jgi:protein-tyrosine phosphatase